MRIAVNGGGDGIDEFDDQLGHSVARRSFTTEDHRPRCDTPRVPTPEAGVECHQIEHVEMLTLVSWSLFT